ncbi:MAG: phage virion morphogenesis protein [Parashewanella sp.]
MSLTIQTNKQQALKLSDQLALLALPRNKRVKILKTLGRQQKAKARKRIQQQKTVDGKSFSPRKDGRKTKMLRKMAKSLEPYVKNADHLELKHKKAFTGKIAALHQDGGTEKMTSGRMRKIHGTPDYDAQATRAQAKALIKEGYKVKRAKGKGYRRASIKEIQERLTIGQAGLILRKLRGKRKTQSWEIEVDERPFLGDTPQNVRDELIKLLEQARG